MHLFATCKCMTSIKNDFHSLAWQTSCRSVKAPQKEIGRLRSDPCLRFRPRLIARANDIREEVVDDLNAHPWNANHYLPNEAPSSLRSSNGRRYSTVPEHTTASSKQAKFRENDKQELGLVVDGALEQDYGLLKEKIEEDRRIQLASKQDSDEESTAETIKSLKRSKVIAKQVISQSSARLIGFVSQLWVSVKLFQVVALEVRPSLLSGEIDRIFLADVCQIGDVVLINDDSALENEMTAVDCETLVGYDVVTEDGNYIGKIRDYSFNLQDGMLMSFDFDAVGFSIVPSSLISTYRLDAEEVREFLTDSILVKAGAESRIRRLTKGFWQLPNVGQIRRSQMVARSRMRSRRKPELSEFARQSRPLPSSPRPRIFEGIDMGGSGASRELTDSGPLPEDYDWPPQSRVK